MARNTSILAIHMRGSDDMGIGGDDSFYLTISFTGVLTVCPDKFLHGEMLVGVMPINPSVGVEVFTNCICILLQNSIPKFSYIHSILSITKIVDPSLSYSSPVKAKLFFNQNALLWGFPLSIPKRTFFKPNCAKYVMLSEMIAVPMP